MISVFRDVGVQVAGPSQHFAYTWYFLSLSQSIGIFCATEWFIASQCGVTEGDLGGDAEISTAIFFLCSCVACAVTLSLSRASHRCYLAYIT